MANVRKRSGSPSASKPKRKPKVRKHIAATSQSAWTTIHGWCVLTGMSDQTTYNRLSTGDLKARKVGKLVLINVQEGLRWLESLPAPRISLKRAQRLSDASAPQAAATP